MRALALWKHASSTEETVDIFRGYTTLASTPEGKIKAKVRALLKRYAGLYVFMPVQTGFGLRTVDYLICFRGLYLAIETKAPGKEPTKLQAVTIGEIAAAGGQVFVVDGDETLAELASWLEQVDRNIPCISPVSSKRS